MSTDHNHVAAAFPLLLIDAGNSRVKWAWLDAKGQRQSGGPFNRQLSAEAEAQLHDAWRQLLPPRSIWISNVAGPDVAARVAALLERQWPAVPRTTIVSREQQCGVINRYRSPSQLGSDRWAGMIGARAAYPGEALLIATLGTATTLDALTADGQFVGGMIAPGWSLMMRSLGEHTAQLPTMGVDDAAELLHDALPARNAAADSGQRVSAMQEDAFARDTASALAEGCRLAQVGLIEAAWHRHTAHASGPVRCIIGGGAAPAIERALTIAFTRHDELVLEGLALIAGTMPT